MRPANNAKRLARLVPILASLVLPACSTTFIVNSADDPGTGNCDPEECTLREAILAANSNHNGNVLGTTNMDYIDFKIDPQDPGPHTINLKAPLPSISEPVFIRGLTQPGFTDKPILELNGAGAGAAALGLRITGGASIVQGLVINRFSSHGIQLQPPAGAGTSAFGGNIIIGNYIGTDITGAINMGNGGNGVEIFNSTDNAIGMAPLLLSGAGRRPSKYIVSTAAGGLGNTISGNTGYGVHIHSVGVPANQTTRNFVVGNHIGTNADSTAVPNASGGVIISKADGNSIGSLDARNVVWRNNGHGVRITDGASNNIIRGNYISGNSMPGDGAHGIFIDGGAKGNRVLRNFIGTTIDGNAALGNSADGIQITASNNIIGGTTEADRNVISGNTTNGIHLYGPGAQNNQVLGNYIGTNAAGTAPVPNVTGGVVIRLGASNNAIGGTTAAARNLISGNRGSNVRIDGSGISTTGNQVLGNYIGTDRDGTLPLDNTPVPPNGILIKGADSNIIGGDTAGAGNVISGNFDGVSIQGPAGFNRVQGNLIGTNAAGAAPLGNAQHGVNMVGIVNGTLVGGTTAQARNVISGNDRRGINIEGSAATSNQVQRNYIGTNKDAVFTASMGNGEAGVRIVMGVGNLISTNAISSNLGLGIELVSGGNNLQTSPVLASAVASTGQIGGTLNSSPSTFFALEFFTNPVCDPSGRGEGHMFIGGTTVTTDGGGAGSFTAMLLNQFAAGAVITSTARDPTNNTSAFSLCIVAN